MFNSKSNRQMLLGVQARFAGCFTLDVLRWLGILLAATTALAASAYAANDPRGNQLLSWDDLAAFDRQHSAQSDAFVMTSPIVTSDIEFDQLIMSWNAELGEDDWMKLEAQVTYPDRMTEFYVMGLWARNRSKYPRESVRNQRDRDGQVETDTLVLNQSARKFRLRVTIGPTNQPASRLKFLAVCLTDTRTKSVSRVPNESAWGTTIPVPEKSQMHYPNGGVLCSPTTVSMILAYWSQRLDRADLAQDVPEISEQVYDRNWRGTGNWVFNTAWAGSLPGMRAYVTRFSEVREIEDWIERGIPVGVSLCYNRLRGKSGRPSGHLVVLVGFTSNGDVVVNDPGTSKNVRKTFPRANFIDAWAHSKNTVYLIYPRDLRLPPNKYSHW